MTFGEHIVKNIKLAYPVMIGQLGHIMVSVADTAMVGRVGVIPLAAATFAGTIYHILILFGIGVSYAITPLVASTDESDFERKSRLLQNALILNIAVSIVLFLISILAFPFLGYFGQEEQVAIAAGPYLIIASSSLIPLMIFQTFRQYSEGLSNTFSPMVISIIANLLNVGFNYILIFGHLGFPALGLNGAGYATLIARVIMAFLMFWALRKSFNFKKVAISWERMREMLRIGIPSGLQYVFEVGAFAFAAIMVGWIGASELAAHQIALNISAITYMSATGIAAAATVRIGNQVRAKDLINLKVAGISCFTLVAIFMAACGVIFIIFNYELVSLYIEDEQVRVLSATLLIIAAAFQVSDGLQAVGLGVLRGLTDVKVPTLVTFIAYWLISIPLGYILGFIFDLGIHGVWYALLTGLSIAAVLHIYRFNAKLKKISF
jgi:MATE family multidrug resistance protein